MVLNLLRKIRAVYFIFLTCLTTFITLCVNIKTHFIKISLKSESAAPDAKCQGAADLAYEAAYAAEFIYRLFYHHLAGFGVFGLYDVQTGSERADRCRSGRFEHLHARKGEYVYILVLVAVGENVLDA